MSSGLYFRVSNMDKMNSDIIYINASDFFIWMILWYLYWLQYTEKILHDKHLLYLDDIMVSILAAIYRKDTT